VVRIKRRQRRGAYTFYTPQSFRDLLTSGGFVVDVVEPIFARQCLIARASKPVSPPAGEAISRPVTAGHPDVR
jgi:hypothetical protein